MDITPLDPWLTTLPCVAEQWTQAQGYACIVEVPLRHETALVSFLLTLHRNMAYVSLTPSTTLMRDTPCPPFLIGYLTEVRIGQRLSAEQPIRVTLRVLPAYYG